MHIGVVDERNGLEVWFSSAPTAAEWDAHFTDVERIAGWSKKLGYRSGVLLLRSALTMRSWIHPEPSYDIDYLPNEDAWGAWIERRRTGRCSRMCTGRRGRSARSPPTSPYRRGGGARPTARSGRGVASYSATRHAGC